MRLAVPLSRGLQGLGLSLLGAAILMWVALADGRPAVFSDTALYYDQAEYLFEALHWVSPNQAVSPPGDPAALPVRAGEANVAASIDGARSPVYGAVVYALQRAGGLWLVAAAQAWAASGAVYLLYRASAPSARRWGYLVLMAGLAVLTTLPVFTGWIMPDAMAGVAACGLLVLLVYPDRLGRGALGGVVALTAYGLAVHRSNLLDAAGAAACAAALLRLFGARWRSLGARLALVALAAGAAVAVSLSLSGPIQARAGQPIGSPPFMSARVLADGPGRRYLRRVCAATETPYALCAFRNRPLATSDQILWSHARSQAVFYAASPVNRLRMAREDARFALAVTVAEPWAQGWAAARNAAQQFAFAYVDDPLRDQGFYVTDDFWRRTVLPRILPGAAQCADDDGCPTRVAKPVSWVLEGAGLILAALILAWRLSAADVTAVLRHPQATGWRDQRARTLASLGVVLGLLIVNAAVCGALSGPFPRYQARLVWLFPLQAGLCVAALGVRRRPSPPGFN